MKKCNYSKEIVNVVKQFLDEDNWEYSFDETKGNFEFGLRIGGKIQKIRYVIDVKEEEMIVYGFSHINADNKNAEMMSQMAEFICRINYGVINGNFEMDYYDGEVRYKSYVDCENMMPPAIEVVKNSVYHVAAMFMTYGEGILDIIFKDSTAKEAYVKSNLTFDDDENTRIFRETTDTDTQDMLSCYAQQLGITEEDIQELSLSEEQE